MNWLHVVLWAMTIVFKVKELAPGNMTDARFALKTWPRCLPLTRLCPWPLSGSWPSAELLLHFSHGRTFCVLRHLQLRHFRGRVTSVGCGRAQEYEGLILWTPYLDAGLRDTLRLFFLSNPCCSGSRRRHPYWEPMEERMNQRGQTAQVRLWAGRQQLVSPLPWASRLDHQGWVQAASCFHCLGGGLHPFWTHSHVWDSSWEKVPPP